MQLIFKPSIERCFKKQRIGHHQNYQGQSTSNFLKHFIQTDSPDTKMRCRIERILHNFHGDNIGTTKTNRTCKIGTGQLVIVNGFIKKTKEINHISKTYD